MSLIHEALKKAAAEGEADKQESTSQAIYLKVSTPQPRLYLWFLIGSVFLALFLFLFSNQHKISTFSQPDKTPTPPAIAHSSNPASEQKQIASKAPSENPPEGGKSLPSEGIENKKAGEKALKEGIVFYKKGEFDRAHESFRKAVELIPSSPIAHNNLGLVVRQQGKMQEALNHYAEAIHLDPVYAEAENNIGLIHDQIGSIDEAIVHYKRAIEIKPAVAAFHLNYATLLERKGDFSSARREYQLFLDLENNPRNELLPQVRSRLRELRGLY